MILWKVRHHKCGIIYNILDKLNYIIIADNDIGAIAPLEDESRPKLVCSNCRAKFEYKKLTTVSEQLK